MKPNFALNFTDDSIALLHRTRRGWAELGRTAFDVDDLPAALADLKAKAEAVAPEGITTKLVIPNSQIKYLRLPAPGPQAAARQKQIAAALEGQTPYDVADLVWDHSGDGDTVTVAVLARETLDEAEGFAADNGFNPVSFVAIPEDADFAGEPWFGPSARAAALLKKGETVERDADPIRLTDDFGGEDAPAIAAAGNEEPEPEPAPEITPADDPLPEPEPTTPEPTPVELPEPAAPELPDEAPLEDPPFDDQPGFALERAAQRAEAVVDPAAIAATLRAGDPPMAEMRSGQTSVLSGRLDDVDEAPIALDVPDEVTDPKPVPRNLNASVLTDPSVEDDLPPPPSGPALAAYGRRPNAAPAEPSARPAPVAPPIGPATAEAPRGGKASERPPGTRPPPKFGYETPGEKPPAPPVTKAARGMSGLVTAPSIPGGRKPKVAPISSASATPAAPAEATAAQAARRPTGLGSRPMPVRGKPRHLGLILTGILLIMLALAAGFSSFYVSWRDGDTVEPAASAALDTPADQAAEASPDAAPAPEDEMLADQIDPAEITAPDPVTAPEQSETAAIPAPEAPAETAATAAPAEAPPATDGPAPATVIAGDPAPANAPPSEAQDEIFLAASDRAPPAIDPVALEPPTTRADLQPQPQAPPPPFGTVYQFDENGLIRPTPEGIATPEGVLLFAGSPALVPPARPAGIAAAAPQAVPPAEAETAAPAEPAFIIPADPALADNRPQPRPAGLVPAPTESAAEDDASLAPQDGSRIASIRPNARPASLTERAIAAGLILPASAPASGNPSLALVAPEGTVTPLGLAISRRPAARPDDMNEAVAAAVAAAIRLPDPEPPEVLDEVTPETEDEPEVASSSAPRIPATANVAKQATFRNAINLKEMNLIGVYGTSADRYALVRNPNGRYIKVSVGDRLDGGRVAAITASELRYEKRGRMVVLELPNS